MAQAAGGKSELRRAVRRVTPGQGDLKDSGTENIPPPLRPAHRCGVARQKVRRAHSLHVNRERVGVAASREGTSIRRAGRSGGKGEKVR